MNNDCLSIIAQFAEPKQAMRMKPEFTVKFFPKSLTVVGTEQILQFCRWSRHFDTSNLEEVRIVADDATQEIGWVPPTVRKLTINARENPIRIPDTVVEVIFEQAYNSNIVLPDSVRKLVFGYGFDGSFIKWPANLEELRIHGWCLGNGRTPVPILGLPDTVRHIYLSSHLDIWFNDWPASLETLIYDGNPESFGWSISDIWIPDSVKVDVYGTAEIADSVWDL